MSLRANLRAVDRTRATQLLTAWTCEDREAFDQVLAEANDDPGRRPRHPLRRRRVRGLAGPRDPTTTRRTRPRPSGRPVVTTQEERDRHQAQACRSCGLSRLACQHRDHPCRGGRSHLEPLTEDS